MARNSHGRYYRGSVMNVGESEGSDSSGRVDMEINASDDFSIPMRKCFSSNLNRQDVFDIPTQVLPLSGISPAQRKGLLLRLRAELEQVIVLQKKIELQRTNRPSVPSSSNIHSSNNIQNGNRTENLQRSSMDISGPGKPLNPQNNKGTAGKPESVRQAPVPNSATLSLMRSCESLLKRLMSHQFGWIFNSPVDVVKLNLPDYFTVIKHPMDLGTVKGKLASGVYSSPLEFGADVRLTFSNAKTYNPPGNDAHIMADSMSKFFEARWKAIEKKVPVTDRPIVPERLGISEGNETAKPMPPSKRRKIISLQQHTIPEPTVERIMTDAEKITLGRELESLLAELPDRIVDFLRENSCNGTETGDDEIEIDIDEFSDDKLFRLRKLIDEYLEEKEKNHAKGEPCEIELLNEPGLSNSSIQPWAVDEDVDIGGNEPPVSSYPPIEIEKDSDTEADGAKPSIPVNVAKVVDLVETEIQPDGKSSGDNHSNGDKSESGVNELEVKVQHVSNSVESDYCQDGDNAATATQVSPNKLYRAALLKNRFADTILKAREKTLVQGEKKDPEKLKREKEELEIQRRKEKARLQAEAKAAEDSRRRAEAEAVLEAKRKREVEREAARQALLKVEKTVEINENSRFLKDLEMLRSATVEPLPIPVNETSPEHSQDGMGGFNFGGSNPLEQLGLYMRNDDEEEEGEHHNIPNPLEQLGLFMKRSGEEEEGEQAGTPNTLEQHGLYMKNGDEEEEGDQLGLYMKKDDDEEEGEIPSNPNTLEQLGSHMKIDDDTEEGELPSRPNTMEQIGLYMRNDDEVEQSEDSLNCSKQGPNMKKDEEEEEGELPGIPNNSKQSGLNMGNNDEEEQGEARSIPNTFELPMVKDDEEEQGKPPSIPNTFELPMVKDDEEEQGKPPSIPNTLEQLEFPTGKDKKEDQTVSPSNPNTLEQPENPTGKGDIDEKPDPPSVPNTIEQLVSNMETDDDVEAEVPSIPSTLEQLVSIMETDDDVETEVPSIPSTLEQPVMTTSKDGADVQIETPSIPKNCEQLGFSIRKDDEEGPPKQATSKSESSNALSLRRHEQEGEIDL